MKNLFYLFLISFTITSCVNDDVETIAPQTEQDIISFLEANNIDAERTNNGLYYIIEEEGTGENPTSTSNVTVAYTGFLLNGTVFDQSSAEGVSFGLDRVIAGWTLGIPLFKEGGKGKLFIHPVLGYGNRPPPGIPPNAVLIFDIHLISIN